MLWIWGGAWENRPPPLKRPAGLSPKAHVDNKLRKQLVVKIVSTTFSATYVRQWACVAKSGPTNFRVNPTSWAGVLSVVFQRLKPLHRQMIKMFKRIEGDGWLVAQPKCPDIFDTAPNDACLNSGIRNSQTSSSNIAQSKNSEATQLHDPTGIRVAPGRPTHVAMLTPKIAPGVGSNANVVVQGAWGGGVSG